MPTPALLAELTDTPELAATAADHPATFADLVAAWSTPAPPAELVDPTPTEAFPAVPSYRDVLPAAPGSASRPARQHREPGRWFDRNAVLPSAAVPA